EDEFGNRVLELRHARIEREFHFQMTLTTVRDSSAMPREDALPATGLGAFLLSSALCDLDDEICRAAHHLRDDNHHLTILRQAQDRLPPPHHLLPRICEWTHHALRYELGPTSIDTTASQALARGVGVCQDYAHLMIAVCRALGIPARYISGFNPAEGLMHAWVEALCDGQWQGWDPTHNRLTRPDCVFVACGRDFRDVSPITGSYRGRSEAQLQVFCRTEVRPAAPD
ncbi:MAG: transglutaminase family protein, partial [Armatimonadota bacterium]|nr:transglutaminase family protein [Armatimonadota bacterium]